MSFGTEMPSLCAFTDKLVFSIYCSGVFSLSQGDVRSEVCCSVLQSRDAMSEHFGAKSNVKRSYNSSVAP